MRTVKKNNIFKTCSVRARTIRFASKLENIRSRPCSNKPSDGEKPRFFILKANLIVQGNAMHVSKNVIFFNGTHSQKNDYFPYAGRVFRSCISEGRSETTLVVFWASTDALRLRL